MLINSPILNPLVPVGLVFSNRYNSADWTSSGANTTWTFNANSIDSVGTSGGITSYIRYNKWYFQTEKFSIRTLVTINSVTASDKYLGIGLTGVSTFSQSTNFHCAIYSESGANQGKTEIYYNGSNLVATSGAARLTYSQGDQIEYLITVDGLTITFSVRSMSNPTVYQIISYTNTNAVVYPGSSSTNLMNINQFAFYNNYGDYTINEFYFTDNEYKNNYLTVVGDSKSEGYYCDVLANRFADLIQWKNGGIVNVSAGSGNTTQDILNALPEIIKQNPKYVLLYVLRNDISNSVPSGTWQANYASIVSQLQAAGITVYHQLPTPETVLDQSAATTYINANYPAPNIISVPATWDNATDLAADGAHLSIEGADKIANNIISVIPEFDSSYTPPLQSDLQDWYDGLSVKPSAQLLVDLNEMFHGMDSDGDLVNLDIIHPYGGLETNEQRLRPIKTNGAANMTAVSSPTVDANGFTGNGTTSHINTGWNPIVHGVKYTQDISSMGIYNRTNRAADASSICGVSQLAPTIKLTRIYPRFTGNQIIYSVNALTESADANSSSHGFLLSVRTLLNLTTAYRNGVSIGTETDTSTTSANGNVYICGTNNVGAGGALLDPTTDNSALFLAGGNVSASRLNFRIRKYMTARSINV